MSNPTYVKLTGWVTKDPKLHLTNADQTPVCTIRMGAASRWPDRASGEWREGPASYFDVVCWRGLATNVSASVRKGDMVTVHGTFRTRTWTDKDNNPRTDIEITANSVGHELLYGWSHYNRGQRASSHAEADLADGETRRGLEPETEAGQDPVSGQPEVNPFDDGYRSDGEPDPAARPAYEPDGGQGHSPADEPVGERIYGRGDEGGADTSQAAVSGPRIEEVAVPV